MAPRLVLLLAAAAVAVACLPAPASAVAWMVGDGGGWRAKFNQTGWAEGKTFRVHYAKTANRSKQSETSL
jgi:hypothetical protein